LVNKIPRQSMIIKKIERLIIVDGCHSKCAKKILDSLGIFTTFKYSEKTVRHVSLAIREKIRELGL